jgi:hypothetical protein
MLLIPFMTCYIEHVSYAPNYRIGGVVPTIKI